MPELIRTEVNADGVLVATIAMADRTVNVFSAELMDELDALMDRVDADATVKSCVVTSGKPSFLAGADLVMVRGYCDAAATGTPAQMFEMCGRLGRQFVRLEASAKPWVAAVNGLALGGGLELAMACRARLVADDPKIQLGLPEVKLGLLPGAGGTQRLPRFVGTELGLDMLLSGRPIAPQAAVDAGLFARAVPAARLLEDARALARSLHGVAYDPTTKFAQLSQADVPAASPEAARTMALSHAIGPDDFGLYPAYSAIIDSVLLGARAPLAEATTIEMNQFLRLMFSPVAGNMIRTLFLNRRRADREQAPPAGLRIEQLTLGACSPGRGMWAEALTKARARTDAGLPTDTAELVDSTGARHRFSLRVCTDAPDTEPNGVYAVLSAAGAFGSVLEVVAADNATAAALAALAQRLRALPYHSIGAHSGLLAQAREPADDADAQALAALRHSVDAPIAAISDLDGYDVAVCTAGLAPAWSGGPFTHLWQQRERLTQSFDATMAQAWDAIEPVLRLAKLA